MSNLQDLIKKIQVSSVNNESYIYYNKDSGVIHQISGKNNLSNDYAIMPVPSEEVEELLTGQRRIEDYVVTYDLSLKEIRLKEVEYEDNHKTASTMSYQLPLIKQVFSDGHLSLEKVYQDTYVFLWTKGNVYNKGQCVWYKNNIYKLSTDLTVDDNFDIKAHKLFLEKVIITTLATQARTTEKIELQPEYVGVHIDVWYDKLSHLAGQHVFAQGNVWKLLKDTKKGSAFDKDNAELLVENVKLYADKNKALDTVKSVKAGDMLLDNNSLYRSIYNINITKEDVNSDKDSIFFYNTPHTLLHYKDKKCYQVNIINTEDDKVVTKDIKLKLKPIHNLKKGQLILSGKELYQVCVNKQYDIVLQQDTLNHSWNVIINPYTKKFLLAAKHWDHSSEILHLSVTSKYDPNILYRSLEFNVGDLLDERTSVIPFIYDIELSEEDVSIYTAKYFDSYAHEVIKWQNSNL